MKTMKGLGMNRMFKRKPSNLRSGDDPTPVSTEGETPEATAGRCVRAFCESGGPNGSGDEVAYLPTIVEAAESSPAAATECARVIRKLLHRDYWSKPSWQYNALMLTRILSDNPGPSFTRNLDKKFVDATKELLRNSQSGSVRQMLMETLDSFETTKAADEGLAPLIEMWNKEKQKVLKVYGGQMPSFSGPPQEPGAPPFNPHSQNYFARAHSSNKLPDPVELAGRLEEARTSAKLLQQVLACTPPAEMLTNELMKEFADRCLSASRSIQRYMVAENPGPDNDTMESLIDTSEIVQTALNHHKRAVLAARKHLGINERSADPSPAPSAGSRRPQGSDADAASMSGANLSPPPMSGRRPHLAAAAGNGKGKERSVAASPVSGPSRSANATPNPEDAEDPFRDPQPALSTSSSRVNLGGGHNGGSGSGEGRGSSSAEDHPGGPTANHQADLQPSSESYHDGSLYDDEDRYGVTPQTTNHEPIYRY